MTKRRVDSNQRAIVAALRGVGASVADLHEVGRGVPDLLVGWRGYNYLLEVKSDGGRLTPRERKWLDVWRGRAVVVRDVSEALAVLGTAPGRERCTLQTA